MTRSGVEAREGLATKADAAAAASDDNDDAGGSMKKSAAVTPLRGRTRGTTNDKRLARSLATRVSRIGRKQRDVYDTYIYTQV